MNTKPELYQFPIAASGDEKHLLQFSHFHRNAPAGLWKKENIIVCEHIKINIFVEGHFSVFSDNALHYPVLGDICMFSPQKMHYGQVPHPTYINYYQLDVGTDIFDHIRGGSQTMQRLLEMLSQKDAFIRPDERSRSNTFSLCDEIETCIFKDALPLAYAKTIELLLLLCRLYASSTAAPAIAFSSHTENTLKYIERHYSTPVTIEEMAAAEQVSTSYLSRIFKKEVGMGLHEYLTKFRINKATEFLHTHSVTETGYLCGFYDSAHFISTFKRHMQITPLDYKRNLI